MKEFLPLDPPTCPHNNLISKSALINFPCGNIFTILVTFTVPLSLTSVSGLSPFLGDDDTQTLNNVVMANWYFDEDAFEHISAEAKDFISNLLIKERR